MTVYELNIDGLVGPTHHYAGLSYGNKASMAHAKQVSNPKLAALEGIAKMRLLHSLGLKQAVLPPHPRPHTAFLSALGYQDKKSLAQAHKDNPHSLSAAFSASSMWAANAATVTPSTDTPDSRVHFTAANLVHHLHRHLEANHTHQLLQTLFPDPKHFVHHPILPKTEAFNDEGAANHNRLAKNHGAPGIHVFVYDRCAFDHSLSTEFPARQTLEASKSIARKHGLNPNQTFFVQQHPEAIDAGVFHNDVISLANESVFLVHDKAFVDQKHVLESIQKAVNFKLNIIEIKNTEISLKEAVKTYLFNAQLVTLPNGAGMALIAPSECEASESVSGFITSLIEAKSNPISSVHYVPVKQSMQNGGGPACLRLRVPLNEHELAAMNPNYLVSDSLLDELEAWVNQHYRESLSFEDLATPEFTKEVQCAFDALKAILP